MKEHTRFVNCVRFSPDGNKLLTVASDKTGFFYDGKTGDLVGKLNPDQAHAAGIYAASWSPDSKRVLTASADKTCKVWDAETGNCVATFNVVANPQVEDQQVGCLWQGDELISVALSGDIYYLDLNNPNQPKRVVRGHQKFVTALAHDSQNNHFYSGSYDSLIVRWDFEGNTDAMVGKGHGNQINRMFVQGNNLVSCAKDDSIRITPLNSRAYSADSIVVDSEPLDLAVGRSNGSLIVSVLLGGFAVVIRDGKIQSKLQLKYQPSAVAISVDETVVAIGGKDNLIHLYQLNGVNLTEGPVLSGHRGPLTSLSFSPDGKYLGSADNNRDIFVFDHHSQQLKIQGWCFHTARVNSLAWSPDSLHLVSGSLDSNLFVWSVEEPGKRIQIKDAHRGGVNTVFFINNNTVISAGQDSTVKTWNVAHH
jgi:WD40 repeat protein